ncbi:SWIM zinc finger family protein [Paenibacillus qinlingensis]|uniref:SWIM zinc finger family protein n=1 Tax=Paenibacillus qinlingensis TaxID=1837343 RepID=UPI001567BCD7|nr:SWIM zinc finger family protein [Paenibacillus qinlingensis]NQX60234.1 SWIM zinc finger family protein [Paenibacillus qinlingensis]
MQEVEIDWTYWIERIRPKFDKVIIVRGWAYYNEGVVRDIQVEGSSIIRARVDGTKSYKVTLDLMSFTKSGCTCPYGYNCKHMAAVLFEFAEQAGYDPEEFRFGKMKVARVVDDNLQKPKLKTRLPEPTDSCEMWLTFFHKQYGSAKIYNAFSLEEVCMRAWRELNKLADTWEPTIRGVYDIHVVLYVIQLCNTMTGSKAITYDFYQNTSYYVKRVLTHTREQLEATLQELDVNRAYKQYGGHLKELSAYLADICENGSGLHLYDWLDLYKLLWSQLFQDKDMLETEKTRLRQVLADPRASQQARQVATLGSIHLDISENEDENAWERADSGMFVIGLDYWFDYLNGFVFESQWDRLLTWLRWLKPKMMWNERMYANEFLHYWRLAAEQREVEKEQRDVMISLLPASYDHYAKFLLSKGEYQEWADLCLLLDLTTEHIDAAQLKLVEKANVRFLLPIYHHAIETFIQGKNRPDYIQAIKLLKKLAAAYKKLKLTPRFEAYLEQIVKEYARYRAFTEELRKGNWIP